MSLVDRIETALDAGVDPYVWEQTATALLQEKYPWLSPVEAGADVGRDADIYNAIDGDPNSRGRLLATTSNVLSNLKSSHASWIKARTTGVFRVDALVIATPNQVTARARSNVEAYCLKHDLPLPQFYSRNWLVPELVTHSAWREKLTGVKGRIDALRPVDRLETDAPLIGREPLLSEIAAFISTRVDLVLTGLPGAGKSRLLPELGQSTYLADPLGSSYLMEDLLALAPTTVAVDDVQLNEDLLSELTAIRAQEGLPFSIVAITWPHYASEAALKLPGCKEIEVHLLPRASMDEIVKGRGVRSTLARQTVLDQAEGRPGWAVMLCNSLISQDGERVVSGELLLERAMRTIRAVSDSELTVDALAITAGLGGASLDDLESIGAIQRRSGVEVVTAIRSVATSGLVELRHDRYVLQPSLRSPLIAQWFFSLSPMRNWNTLVTAFPDRRDALLSAMLEAARSTGPSSAARAASWAWAHSLPDPLAWSEPVASLVRQFALLSAESADWAALAARAIIRAPRRPVVTPWGTERDDLAMAAEGTLRSCVQRYFNKEAVQGLLDIALTDSGPRHSLEKDPIAALGEIAQLLHPDRGTLFEVREKLTKFAGEWLDQFPGNPRAASIYCDVVRRAFAPFVRGTWTDPGQFRTVTLADGIESPTNLAELVVQWSTVMEKLNTSPGKLQIDAINHLIGLVEDWLRVAGGLSRGSGSVSEEQKGQAETGAWTILKGIVPLVSGHQGAVLQMSNLLELASRWDVYPPKDLAFPAPDPELERFVARRVDYQSTEEWMAEQGQLARRLSELGPSAGTARFMELVRTAEEANLRADSHFLALELAKAVDDAGQWVGEAIASDCYSLTYRMIWEVRNANLELESEDLRHGLSRSSIRSAVIGATLEGRVMDESARIVLSALTEEDAGALERLFARESADELLLSLLVHPVAGIRVASALAFGVTDDGSGPPVPDSHLAQWAQAFKDASLATVQGHNRYRLREILEHLTVHNPELCAEWFAERMREETLLSGWRVDRLDDFENIIPSMPRAQRDYLLRSVYPDPATRWRYLPELIGADPELADRLLTDHTITPDDAISGLSGNRDAGAKLLAPVLLRHGVAPERVAIKINGGRSWMGDESAEVKSDIEWFETLRRESPELADMCSISLDMLNQELVRVMEEERIEAVRGWS